MSWGKGKCDITSNDELWEIIILNPVNIYLYIFYTDETYGAKYSEKFWRTELKRIGVLRFFTSLIGVQNLADKDRSSPSTSCNDGEWFYYINWRLRPTLKRIRAKGDGQDSYLERDCDSSLNCPSRRSDSKSFSSEDDRRAVKCPLRTKLSWSFT